MGDVMKQRIPRITDLWARVSRPCRRFSTTLLIAGLAVFLLNPNSALAFEAEHFEDPALALSTAPGGWAKQSNLRLLQTYEELAQKPRVQTFDLGHSFSELLRPFARPTTYEYPYFDHLIASVTASIVRERSADERPGGAIAVLPVKITFHPERSQVPHYGSHNYANVVFSFSSREAPLVVLLGGLGADSDGNMAKFLADQMNDWGFNVLSLPNVFEWSFGLAASRSGVPGFTSEDVEDLERLMQLSYQMIRDQFDLKPQRFLLMGYSMGGFHALKMAELGIQLDKPFAKYLTLNAPINLLYGVAALDQMSARAKELSVWEKTKAIATIVGASARLRFRDINSPNYYDDLDWWFGLEPRKLEYVIGVAMSSSVADTLLMANEIGSNKVLTGRNYYTRMLEARRWYITEYMEALVFPRVAERAQQLGKTFEDLLELETEVRRWQIPAENLARIRYLHNENDFIISPDQLSDLEELFGSHAMIFPVGGHMGNIWYKDNLALIRSELGQP